MAVAVSAGATVVTAIADAVPAAIADAVARRWRR